MDLKKSSSLANLANLNRNEAAKPHKMGSIPKYLTHRKLIWQRAAQRAGNVKTDCPPGHTLLADDERRKTLDMLETAEKDLSRRLNSLPVRSDTLFLQKRKGALRNQLEEVEEAMKIFSKPKVFVKDDFQNDQST